jgi:hypothetical protein
MVLHAHEDRAMCQHQRRTLQVLREPLLSNWQPWRLVVACHPPPQVLSLNRRKLQEVSAQALLTQQRQQTTW